MSSLINFVLVKIELIKIVLDVSLALKTYLEIDYMIHCNLIINQPR